MRNIVFIITNSILCLLIYKSSFSQNNKTLIKNLNQFEKKLDSLSHAFINNEEIIKEQFNIMLSEQRAEIDKLKHELETKTNEAAQLNIELTEKESYINTQEVFVGLFLALCFVALGALFWLFTTIRDKKKINQSLADKNELIRSQVVELKSKNIEITDSIRYAKKIQDALLLSQKEIREIAPESFVYFRPKDIISGDFYWMIKKGDLLYVATADCTGHGVPGSLMSMLGLSHLEKIIVEKNILAPADILNELKKQIIIAMNKSEEKGSMKDGMDMSLYCLDMKNNVLTYSAANNGIYIIRGKEIIKLEPEKQPVGPNPKEHLPFNQFEFKLMPNDMIVTYSDGFADQFGGLSGKKFKYKQLQELLLNVKDKPIHTIPTVLNTTFEKWKGKLEQVDDVLLIGIKV